MKNIIKTLLVFFIFLESTPLSPMEEPRPEILGMDNLLKQLESELPPEAKKARTLEEIPTPISTETPEELFSWPKIESPELPSEKPKTKKFASTNKFEPKIISVFNKIGLIADGLIKAIGSKETQDWIEIAKKRRLEETKKFEDKMSKSFSSRTRSSYSGSSSGSSGWGGGRPYGSSGYGSYGGSGGYGSGSYGKNYWNPSSSFNTPTPTQETPSSSLDTTKSPEEEKEKKPDLKGTFSLKEQENEQKAESLSATLRATLEKVIKEFNTSIDQNKITRECKNLESAFDKRNDVLNGLTPTKQNAIKDKERPLWNQIFRHINTFKESCNKLVLQAQRFFPTNKPLRSPDQLYQLENTLKSLQAKIPSDAALQTALSEITKTKSPQETKEVPETKTTTDSSTQTMPEQQETLEQAEKEQIKPTDKQESQQDKESAKKELNIIIENALNELIDSKFIGLDNAAFLDRIEIFLKTTPTESPIQQTQPVQSGGFGRSRR